YAFANALEYNQDLGDWNTSQVTQMDAMFSNATVFNQDLSGWCVSLIDKAPTNFSTGSLISQTSLPLWGTCPD
ncbi:MAG: BspA family leucine-rich repeat surface protein, partial [Flavobacteriaceae bacterium]|nr:BspA family leucine-rich repeat surface protein [Flavobacteriaceae bacterium]